MKHFEIIQVKPKIFLFHFKDRYEMCMHFLRFQENYESPSPKFRNKSFTIFDFMKWYSKTYGKGAFTYTNDWSGFNISGSIIKDLYPKILDLNDYDKALYEGYNECVNLLGEGNESQEFSIIGTTQKTGSTLRHECAHAFYFLNKDYKKEMNKLLKDLPKEDILKMKQVLKDMGYASAVHLDEIQAYLSTGSCFSFTTSKQEKTFKTTFNKYYKK